MKSPGWVLNSNSLWSGRMIGCVDGWVVGPFVSGNCAVIAFYCMCFLPFFICYEVVSVFYIVVFTIPGFFICPYGRFLKNILFGKILGELFPV